MSVSIPILLDYSAEVHYFVIFSCENISFQSLFYWIILRKCLRHVRTSILIVVSIPILLDYSAEGAKGNRANPRTSVSIPILLDYSAEARFLFFERLHQVCFNPYSIRLFCGRKRCEHSDVLTFEFQSLFYWIILRKNSFCVEPVTEKSVSIPILLDYSAEEYDKRSSRSCRDVSIPILLDYSAEDYVDNETKHLWFVFQSLFYWIILRKKFIYP